MRKSAILEKIVIPVDGSELSERILSQVKRILIRRDAEVVVVRVVPPESMVSTGPDPLEVARAEIDRLVRRLRDDGVTARGEVLVGDPAERIATFAAEESASLIALATHGRTGLPRWVRGSTAERVLRTSTVPLLLANPAAVASNEELRFRRILVPLDGSERSASVFPLVREIARLEGSEVILHYVIELLGTPEFSPYATALSREEAVKILESFRSRLEGVRVSTAVDVARAAAAEILDRAAREKADLVVLSTHGRTGLARWAFGSVAEKVLRLVSCPVLAVRTVALAEEHPEAAARRSARG